MNNPVGWFEIYVDDMNRAKAFYEAVFNVQLSKLDSPEVEMWAFSMNPDAPGATGSLIKMPGYPIEGNSVLVYFSCADCKVEAERAAARGGKIHKQKTSIGEHGYIALIVDTEGNMIGLHSLQ